MSRVSRNDTQRLRKQLQRATEDGRVTKQEGRALAKTAKKDGVQKAEQKLLNRALTHRNDVFEPAAQTALARVAKFKLGSNIAPNSPDQVRAEVRRARHDGSINETEAQRISGRLQKGGVTDAERAALRVQLDKHSGAFKPAAKELLESLFRNTEAAQPGAQVQFAGGLEIRGNGVRPSAVAEAVRIANELTASRPDIAERLRAAGHVVVVIPKDVKLTDLPEFASLKGQKTFDGRDWDGVRGVANVTGPDGRLYTAVAEENLSRLSSDNYGNESVAIHEIAHAIHRQGLRPEEYAEVKAAFDEAKARGGPFSSDYGANNEFEYFAELAGTYFSRSQSGDAQNAEWIRQNDPRAFELLNRIFGGARAL